MVENNHAQFPHKGLDVYHAIFNVVGIVFFLVWTVLGVYWFIQTHYQAKHIAEAAALIDGINQRLESTYLTPDGKKNKKKR